MKQFFDAVDFIEANLDQNITLDDVARAAGYSAFHFARMFRAISGLSVMGYIRRRRLSLAAQRLLSEEVRLIELALDCGFESQEAFTRAFKRAFGMTPGEYRKHTDPIRFGFQHVLSRDLLHHFKENMTVEPKIVEHPGFKAVGVADYFTQDTTDRIGDLWRSFNTRVGEISNMTGDLFFGICDDFDEKSGSSKFRYTAAAEVTEFGDLPEGMDAKEIGPQKYAVFTHKVTSPDLSADFKATLNYIWGTWFPQSNYERVPAPDFELYDSRFIPPGAPDGPGGEIDVYIPVKRK